MYFILRCSFVYLRTNFPTGLNLHSLIMTEQNDIMPRETNRLVLHTLDHSLKRCTSLSSLPARRWHINLGNIVGPLRNKETAPSPFIDSHFSKFSHEREWVGTLSKLFLIQNIWSHHQNHLLLCITPSRDMILCVVSAENMKAHKFSEYCLTAENSFPTLKFQHEREWLSALSQ